MVPLSKHGDCLKGTVYSVVANNLAAHGLAGFSQSLRSKYFRRFCFASLTEMQTSDALTFEMRTNICMIV